MVLAYPGGFPVGMVRPLHFEEFDRLVASLALSFFNNSNGVLTIRQVFLEINLFKNSNWVLTIREIFLELNVLEVDGAVRSLEALSELRDMEHIMNICKV